MRCSPHKLQVRLLGLLCALFLHSAALAVRPDLCLLLVRFSVRYERVPVGNYCCDKNVHKMIAALRAEVPNFDLSKAKVLFILRFDDVLKGAMKKHSGTELDWSYHVVMEYEGSVFDLDWRLGPEPQTRNDYFTKMFLDSAETEGEKSLMQERMFIRAVPAQEYLDEYGEGETQHDHYYYRYQSDARYPRVTLADYIGK